MELSLKGKSALVTGGSTGIGFAVAQRLGSAGASLSICSRHKEPLEAAVEALQAEGINAWGMTADVSDRAGFIDFGTKSAERSGKIDILVNNASIYPYCRLLDAKQEDWEKTFAVNLGSVFNSIEIIKEFMVPRAEGVVINAASFASIMGSVGTGIYASSKAAVAMLTRCMASELAPHGIRVNAYIPGVVETDMTRGIIEKNPDAVRNNISLNRIGDAEDVANAVLFLASEMASYITGASIEVTGGKFSTQNPADAWRNKNEA